MGWRSGETEVGEGTKNAVMERQLWWALSDVMERRMCVAVAAVLEREE